MNLNHLVRTLADRGPTAPMSARRFSIVLVLIVSLSGCGLIEELIIIFSPAHLISGPVQITDGQSFTLWKPLKVIAKRHKLSIRTDAVEGFDDRDPDHETLTFKNGASGRVTAQLLDQHGETHTLVLTGVGGADGGFYLGKKASPDRDFPNDSRFSEVSIQTEVEFEADRIEWIVEVPK